MSRLFLAGPAFVSAALLGQGEAPDVELGPDVRVWYVDNRADPPGDGGRATPFPTLAQAEAASGEGDVLFVYAGDGTSRGLERGVRLQAGQQLVGEGVGLVVGGEVRVKASASRPRLANPGGVGIVLADGSGVAGLDLVDTAEDGLLAAGCSGVVLRDLVVEPGKESSGQGIRVVGPGSLHLERVRVRGAADSAVRIDGAEGLVEVEVHDSELVESGRRDGLSVEASGGEVALRIAGTVLSGHRGAGLRARFSGAASGLVVLAGSDLGGNDVAVDVAHQAAGKVRVELIGNRINQEVEGKSTAINVLLASASDEDSRLEAEIRDNRIGSEGRPGSGSQLGAGIALTAGGEGVMDARVEGNVVREVRQESGLVAHAVGGSAVLLLALVANDIATSPVSDLALSGVELLSGASGADHGRLCVRFDGNRAFRGGKAASGISVQTVSGEPAVALEGYAGPENDETALRRFLSGAAESVTPAPEVYAGAGSIGGTDPRCTAALRSD